MGQVGDVMIKMPVYCTSDTRISEIKYLMKKYNYEEILVVDTVLGKKPVGVIQEEDIENDEITQSFLPSDKRADECMVQLPLLVQESFSLENCLLAMEESHRSCLPVIDEEGHFVGIIQKNDIIL